MKLLKISSISLLVMFSFIFVSPVLAEENTAPAKTDMKTITLATVNIQDAKIIFQNENDVNISFNITNREGAQSGLRYGVKLLKQVDKKQTTVDEYIYPEVLSIAENTSLPKNITYHAPVYLDGTYTLMILAKNYSGLPLGNLKVGDISLTSSVGIVEIIPETCSISLSSKKESNFKLSERAEIKTQDDLILTCTVKNNKKEEALITPMFETYYNSIYGERISQIGGDISPILLQAGESKVVKLAIPKATVPQLYVTKFYLQTKDTPSNYVLVNYTLSGLSATIQNFSIDKTSYKTNETAKLSFFWTSSSTKKEELSAITLNANILNKNDKECISPLSQQMAGVGFIEIPVSINRTCENPKVSIELKDAEGNILDQKALAFEANEKISQNIFSGNSGITIAIILALIIAIGLVVSIKNNKKKDDDYKEPKTGGHIDGSTLAVFFFIFMFGLALIPGGKVSADTTYGSACDLQEPPYNCESDYIVFNVNLDKSTYVQGETIVVSSSIGYSYPPSMTSMNLGDYYHASPEWGGDIQFFDHNITDFDSVYFIAPTYSSEVKIYVDYYSSDCCGPTFGQGYGLYLPFTVSAPAAPASVVVTATNVNTGQSSTDQIIINAGTQVDIKWTTQNATSSTHCLCNNGSCGESIGIYYSYPFFGGRFTPTTTTTYTVNCQ